MKTGLSMAVVSALILFSTLAVAKGLDEISEANPANDTKAAEEAAPTDPNAPAEPAPPEPGSEPAADAQEASAPPSELRKSLSKKLYLATSFGWASASKSEGEWQGSGASDITIGYKLPVTVSSWEFFGTYRYAPIAVVGEIDDHSYRGVFETHYFGSAGFYQANSKVKAVGTAELGYTLVYLNPTDNLPGEDKHEDNGVSVALGGGADWTISDQFEWTIGPRATVGFGGISSWQLGAASTFMF